MARRPFAGRNDGREDHRHDDRVDRRDDDRVDRRNGTREDRRDIGRDAERPVAPWIRTRLRAAPGAAVALALLVLATVCLAASFPRAVDRYEDAGLREAVADATARRTSVQVWAPPPALDATQEERESVLRPASLRERYERILKVVERPLVADPGQSTYGVRTTKPLEVPEKWLPRPSGLPAQMTLAVHGGLDGHARLRAGRLPRTDGTVTAATPELEAAVTRETADRLHIGPGAVIHVPAVERAPLAVRVTGIVAPRDPEGAYWSTQPVLRTPALMHLPTQGAEPSTYWLGALLLAPDAAPALLGTSGAPARYWQLAPDPGALTARDLPRLAGAIAALESGPGLLEVRELTDPAADTSTDLDDVLTSYAALRSGVRPLVAVAASGSAAVAVVVLLMAGGLAADRRRGELALLRARGASLRGLMARLCAETAVVTVPAAALGLAVALLVVPYGRLSYAASTAAAVALLACAVLPVRAWITHRAVRVHGAREDLASARPSRRRTVAELTLLVIASAAVLALRGRGTSGGSGAVTDSGDPADLEASGDQLVALAPVLIGVIAALVLVRLHPLPLRRLARPAERLRGAVGHLSLARAGRTSASAVLPLLALLTALTTAAFGGSVLAGVADTRDRAALLTLGADARVEVLGTLPAALPEQLRSASGVREVTPLSLRYEARPGTGVATVPLAGVDPEGYARLAGSTRLGAFPAGELKAPAATEKAGGPVLPALASPVVADRYGTRPFPVRLGDGSEITVRITVVRELTPAVPGTEFLVVDRAGLGTVPARPTALLLTGDHLDAAALREAAGPAADVRLRSAERARYVDSPLQSGAERVYAVAVAAGSGYAVVALLLALIRAAPERSALLARLRTMGLTRAQGRRLLVLEALPQALLAAVGGALTGWATVRLLAPGVDLTAVALATPGGAPPPGTAVLHADPVSLLLPALAVLLVATGIAAGQAWWTGRRGSVRELRAGDAR